MLPFTTTWFAEHQLLAAALVSASLLLLAVTVFATPWLLARLPRDYFSVERRPGGAPGRWSLALLVLRTLFGLLLVVLGLVMMITPGPGLIALLLGLSLCEFPGRHALLRRLAARPNVFASLNWLRGRTGSPPFRHPDAPRPDTRRG